MTYKVPSPKVFMSFNDDVNRVFKQGISGSTTINTSVGNFIELAKKEGVYIAGPDTDIQILDFEHNIAGTNDAGKAIFTVVDPTGDLETRLFQIPEFRFAEKILEEKISKAELKITETNKKETNSIIEEISNTQNRINLLEDIYNNTKKVNAGISMSCVFSYGVGDKKSGWAGPFLGFVSNVEYVYNGTQGVRVLRFEVVATTGIFNSMPGESLLSYGNTLYRVEGFSENIFDQNGFKPPLLLIQQCLESYLRNVARIPNAMVVLPDFTKSSKFQNDFSNLIIDSGYKDSMKPVNRVIGKSLLTSTLFEYREFFEALGFTIKVFRPNTTIEEQEANTSDRFVTIDKFKNAEETARKVLEGYQYKVCLKSDEEDWQSPLIDIIKNINEYINADKKGNQVALDVIKYGIENKLSHINFMYKMQEKKIPQSQNKPIKDPNAPIYILTTEMYLKYVIYGTRIPTLKKKDKVFGQLGISDDEFVAKYLTDTFGHSDIFDNEYRKKAFEEFWKIEDTGFGGVLNEDIGVYPPNIPYYSGVKIKDPIQDLNENRQLINRFKFPILRGGAVKDPNILQFNFANNSGLFLSLLSVMTQLRNSTLLPTLNRILDKTKNSDIFGSKINDIINAINDHKDSTNISSIVKNKLLKGVSKGEELNQDEKNKLENLVTSLQKLAELSSSVIPEQIKNIGIITYDENSSTRDRAYLTFLTRLMEFKTLLSVTTLPFFYTDLKYLFSPCWFFYQNHKPVGYYNKNEQGENEIPTTDILNYAFSGRYKIVGISHKISRDEATTQFTIIRSTESI